MGWLGPGALVASVIALGATCTSPEPPRDAGPLDTVVVDVPVDLLGPVADVEVVLDPVDCAVDFETDALSSSPDPALTCRQAR
jgi:hypothetical protein